MLKLMFERDENVTERMSRAQERQKKKRPVLFSKK
jgi:hypothetical protein